MLKNIAWNTFKQTGDINSYLEFREVKNIEENMKVILDETNKSKWDNNCRK
ncbi:MAG TPA: YqzL family protein [Candidatus Scatovivens faecipullorum]|nr:YqzL family protein [Candidatus Scatovivens faecipullorum]